MSKNKMFIVMIALAVTVGSAGMATAGKGGGSHAGGGFSHAQTNMIHSNGESRADTSLHNMDQTREQIKDQTRERIKDQTRERIRERTKDQAMNQDQIHVMDGTEDNSATIPSNDTVPSTEPVNE
jgi:hypothetical protein